MDAAARHRRIEQLFLGCADLPEEERRPWLEAKCTDDPALVDEVLELVGRERQAQPALPRLVSAAPPVHASAPPIPASLGPYRLGERLGEGGFGEVFAAEQLEPIQRSVAIKLLKPGMDSRAVLARFEAERHALALMDHPGIARVYDAGTTEGGRPYFVMDLVAGEGITEYCDQRSLSTRERLELMIAVCRAVEHAHQRGVIHRDLKPSNILVSAPDGTPRPRVIDFGIAKATRDLVAGSPHTRAGEFLGTPEFMSPEQAGAAREEGAAIDPRTDVYSLGVVLYRLLSGAYPLEPERLRRASASEVQRILLEEEPPRPSEAALRGAGSSRLSRELRGELDWIVLKAMAKSRHARYDTAAALAEDLERYLNGRPVLAAAPSRTYRIRKQLARHPLLVVASLVLLVAMLVGLATARSWAAGAAGTIVTLAAGLAATLRQAQKARRAERTARREAEVATAVSGFLTRLLGEANPEVNPRGTQITLRELLDRAARELEASELPVPRVEAAVREALARTYLGLGLYDEATEQVRRAAALREREAGPSAVDALECRLLAAEILSQRGRYAEAETRLSSLHDAVEGNARLPVRLRDRYRLLRGSNLTSAGRFAEAAPLLEQVVASRRSAPGGDELAAALTDWARLHQEQGHYAEAARAGREALELMRRFHPGDDLRVARAAERVAGVLTQQKELAGAEALYRESVEICTRVLGREHPSTAMALGNLGVLLNDAGQSEAAVTVLREAHETLVRVAGTDSAVVSAVKSSLGVALQGVAAYDQALEVQVESVAIARRVHGDAHPQVAYSLNNLGALYRLMNRPEQALVVFREALETFRNLHGDEHPLIAITGNNVGKACLDLGRFAEAEEIFRARLELARRVFSATHPAIAVLRANHALAVAGMGRRAEAELELSDALAMVVEALGADHPRARQLEADLASIRAN